MPFPGFSRHSDKHFPYREVSFILKISLYYKKLTVFRKTDVSLSGSAPGGGGGGDPSRMPLSFVPRTSRALNNLKSCSSNTLKANENVFPAVLFIILLLWTLFFFNKVEKMQFGPSERARLKN